MNLGVLLFVFGLSAAVCSADEPSAPAGTAVDAAVAPVADGAAADANDSGKFFLFAQRSVTTSFTITTSATEVLSTCFAASSTTACAGRRKRRFVRMDRSYPSVEGGGNLDSSISGSIDGDSVVADLKEEPSKSSKYFFTLWETSTSTLVVLSTSTNSVNIVSVSAACTIAGNLYPPCG